jgi:signal transduction histidine kinase
VTRAARSGLDVSCRFTGDHEGVPAPTAHIAFRVVQESLTNALRHAPGAAVRVRVGGDPASVTVRVENTRPADDRPGLPGTGLSGSGLPGTGLPGTGRGLIGLRERIQQQGGHLRAGPSADGGWLVEATLPVGSR